MPDATAAAEPLLDPPGVRSRSQGLRVPRGWVAANSVVTVLPIITAPAARSAATAAASRPPRQPMNSGEPCSVTMSAVSMMSLMPTGMPSISDSAVRDLHRAVAASAAVRAAGKLVATKAPTCGSRASIVEMHRSRKARGVSVPSRNACAAAK
jgi:hypothetical protein